MDVVPISQYSGYEVELEEYLVDRYEDAGRDRVDIYKSVDDMHDEYTSVWTACMMSISEELMNKGKLFKLYVSITKFTQYIGIIQCGTQNSILQIHNHYKSHTHVTRT